MQLNCMRACVRVSMCACRFRWYRVLPELLLHFPQPASCLEPFSFVAAALRTVRAVLRAESTRQSARGTGLASTSRALSSRATAGRKYPHEGVLVVYPRSTFVGSPRLHSKACSEAARRHSRPAGVSWRLQPGLRQRLPTSV